MPAKKNIASSSAAGEGKKVVWAGGRVGQTNVEKYTELLNEQEFCERFLIPNGIFIHL